MTWREQAAPIIRKVILEVGTEDGIALKKALRAAYPWGERAMHPYRIWNSEIRHQLSGHHKTKSVSRRRFFDANQKELFENA